MEHKSEHANPALCRTPYALVSQHPTLKKRSGEICRKSLALPEFVQLQSDRSISNLICHTGLSKESRLVLIISGKFITKTVAKMDPKTNHFY